MSAIARPILFSASMIRALLDGRKTQTRRATKGHWVTPGLSNRDPSACRYGAPGDLLWVRETWQHAPQDFCRCPQPSEPSPCDDWTEGTGCRSQRGDVVFRADEKNAPRWASRLTLRITEVRVQRLQEISEPDAIAEGIERIDDPRGTAWKSYEIIHKGPHKGQPHSHALVPNRSPVTSYRELWESLNGAGSWYVNPWVWALTFSVEKRNVNEVLKEAA